MANELFAFPNKRSYPREIIIRGTVWQIRFVRRLDKSNDMYGLCDPSDRTIYVKLGQSQRETFATIVHEILHAFEAEYDQNIPHSLVYAIEEMVTTFFDENLGYIK